MSANPGSAAGEADPAVLDKAGLVDKEAGSNDTHFSTDHLKSNLRNRTLSSGFVTLTAQGTKFSLNIASTMILSRLLSPRDFGLLAMVTALMSLLRIFKDAGLSSATIQRDGITHAQVSNLFWINVSVGGVLAVLMAVAAPGIAWFYHEPKLVSVALWLSMTFLLNGSTVQHQALLRRQMRFVSMAIVDLGSAAFGLTLGVVMAFMGYGYWALVGMNLSAEAVALVLTWWASSWRPQRPRRNSGTRPLLKFGATMTAGSALWICTKNTDNTLVAWRYGADAVGLYSRALGMLTRPLDQMLGPISAVLMPTLSRLQNEPERYRRTFLKIFEGIALVSFTFTGLFLALARPVTLIMLGPKWDQAAVIFSGFTLAALYLPVSSPVAWLMISLGRGKDFLRWNTVSTVITITSFVVGLPFGPVGVAFSYSLIALFVLLPVLYHIGGLEGPVRTRDLWFGFLRHVPLWVIVAGTTHLARKWVDNSSPYLQVLVAGPIGLAAGAAAIMAIKPEREIALQLYKSIRSLIEARRKSKSQ